MEKRECETVRAAKKRSDRDVTGFLIRQHTASIQPEREERQRDQGSDKAGIISKDLKK